MELSQNCKYKPWEIPNSYFHEAKVKIESAIEACQEGGMSVEEAEKIISEKEIWCMDYLQELEEKLNELENNTINTLTEIRGMDFKKIMPWVPDKEEFIKHEKQSAKEKLEKAREDIMNYNYFLNESLVNLWEMLESSVYQQKRKAKIKSQIFNEGLPVSAEKTNNPPKQPSRELEKELFKNKTLPHVIQELLKEGLLKDAPDTDGKYAKKGDKKDRDIIKWIFDYSGYGDSLTYELYMQYIQTSNSPETIRKYIRQAKNEATE